MENKKEEQKFSRREFLKFTGVGLGGAAAAIAGSEVVKTLNEVAEPVDKTFLKTQSRKGGAIESKPQWIPEYDLGGEDLINNYPNMRVGDRFKVNNFKLNEVVLRGSEEGSTVGVFEAGEKEEPHIFIVTGEGFPCMAQHLNDNGLLEKQTTNSSNSQPGALGILPTRERWQVKEGDHFKNAIFEKARNVEPGIFGRTNLIEFSNKNGLPVNCNTSGLKA